MHVLIIFLLSSFFTADDEIERDFPLSWHALSHITQFVIYIFLYFLHFIITTIQLKVLSDDFYYSYYSCLISTIYFFTYFTSAPYRVIAYTEVKRTQSMGPVLPISMKESTPFILKSNEETKWPHEEYDEECSSRHFPECSIISEEYDDWHALPRVSCRMFPDDTVVTP